ncbi:MAG: OmpA family protein, partial [Flavobacteriales bacterium]|nr:OmpA family protein [Flavobacteriales bacterium]
RMNVNPGVKAEIAVHSDSRDGEDAAKMDQRRADAIVEYLVGKSVPRDRLVAKGYGISRLKNHCAPGVTCTEAEHAENRRVEFTIISIMP